MDNFDREIDKVSDSFLPGLGDNLDEVNRLLDPNNINRGDVPVIQLPGRDGGFDLGDRANPWDFILGTNTNNGDNIVGSPVSPVPPISIDESQLGRKLGKHVRDFGGDPSNPTDRANVRERIEQISNNPDRVINGTFMGQGENGGRGPVHFRIQGNDVVVTRPDGTFVTILRNGVLENSSVRQALGEN